MAETKARLAAHYAEVLFLQRELEGKAEKVRRRYHAEKGLVLPDVDIRVRIANTAYVKPKLTEPPSFDLKYYDIPFTDVISALIDYKVALTFRLRYNVLTNGNYHEVVPDHIGRRMQERIERFAADQEIHPPDIPALFVEPNPFLVGAERSAEQVKEHVFWLATWEDYLLFQMKALEVGPKDGMLLSYQAPKFSGFYMIQWSAKYIAVASEFIATMQKIRENFEKRLEGQNPADFQEVSQAIAEYRKQNYVYNEDGALVGLPQPKLFLERLRSLPDILTLVVDPHNRNLKQNR